jgi:hypothetical protein
MPNSPNRVPILVPRELRDKLLGMRRPHQAIAGVIEELISQCEQLKTTTEKKA